METFGKERADWGKFLVKQKGKDAYELIAGRFLFHTHILGMQNDKPNNPEEIVKKHNIVAAGDFDEEGTIEYWDSTGLEVETPLDFRPAIESMIKKNISYFHRVHMEATREKKVR